MNWGYKILFVYSAFVAGILFMVFKASSQRFDLVTNDYYAKELKYQDKIEEMKRTARLSAQITYEVKGELLLVRFPKDFAGKKLIGELLLYCPSDESKDLKKNFTARDEPVHISLSAAKKGQYELHLSWNDGEQSYYFEKKIFI